VLARIEGSNRLIIIDEAHKLNGEAVELLREIHDASGCPIFMLATKDLAERIERSADPDHGQLYSRVDIIWPLTQGHDVGAGGKPLFTIDEIRRLYEQVPIRLSPDAARYLRDVANDLGRGSLRRCRTLVMNAARRARKRMDLAEEETVTVTADDLAYADERLRPQQSDVELVKQRRARVAEAVSA
jgi:DNA helicase TIP49 (TBP-interacting protein)